MKTLYIRVSSPATSRLGRRSVIPSPKSRSTVSSSSVVALPRSIPSGRLLSASTSYALALSEASPASSSLLELSSSPALPPVLSAPSRLRVKSRCPCPTYRRPSRRRVVTRSSLAPAAFGGCWQPQSPAAPATTTASSSSGSLGGETATNFDTSTVASTGSGSSSTISPGNLVTGEPEAADAASISPRTSFASSDARAFLSSHASSSSAPPLKPQTLAGKWLLDMLSSVPSMVPTAVDAELRRLQEEATIGEGESDCDEGNSSEECSVFAILGRANGAAAGPVDAIQGDSIQGVRWADEADLLQSRIWRLQRRDQHDELQELLYALVVLRFVSHGHTPLLRNLPLLPALPPSPWQRDSTYSRANTNSLDSSRRSSGADSGSRSAAFPLFPGQPTAATPAASTAAAAAACCTGLRKMMSPAVRAMVSRHLAMVMASQLEQAPRGVPTSGNGADSSSRNGRSSSSSGSSSSSAGNLGNISGSRNVGAVARPYGPGVLKSSRLRLGQIYASSITYGYFLRQVDLRLQLESCWQLNQMSLLESMLLFADARTMPSQPSQPSQPSPQQQKQTASLPNGSRVALDRSRAPAEGAAEPAGSATAASAPAPLGETQRVVTSREPPSQDVTVTGSETKGTPGVKPRVGAAQMHRKFLERCWQGARDGASGACGGASSAVNAGYGAAGMRKADIGAYLRRLDPALIRQMSKIHSRESLRVIERHTEALFGPPVWEEKADGSLAVRDEVVWLTAGGVERIVLEAVAFGCALQDAEEYVNSIHAIR